MSKSSLVESLTDINSEYTTFTSLTPTTHGIPNDSNCFILKNQKQDSFISQLQQMLAIQKQNADEDLFALLKQIQSLHLHSPILDSVSQFIRDFILIPPDAFTVKQLSTQVRRLSYMVGTAMNNNNKSDIGLIQTVLRQLTNISTVLAGSIQNPMKQNEKFPIIPSFLRPPYLGRDEIMIFNQLIKGLPSNQQRSFFKQNPDQKNMLEDKKKAVQNEPFMSTKQSFDKFKLRNDSLLEITSQIIQHIATDIDEIDGDIRSMFQLSPPMFPANTSPIERSLQFQIDLCEMMLTESGDVQRYLNTIKHISMTGEWTGLANQTKNGSSDYSSVSGVQRDDINAEFDINNPYAFEIDEQEDYKFAETQVSPLNSKSIKCPRPLFVCALASAVSTKAQRALFTLQLEGQIVCGVAALLEAIENPNLTLLDMPALFNIIKYLSIIINIASFYTYGNQGIIPKLLKLQTYANVKAQQTNLMIKSFNRQYFSDPQTEKKFLIYKRGLMSSQVIILNQVVNLYYYGQIQNIEKAIQKEKKKKPAQISAPVTPKSILNSEFQIQDQQPNDDIYVCQKLYKDFFPCDSIYFPITLQSAPQETFFTDLINNNVNRIYLRDESFDILCNCLAQIVTRAKIICDEAQVLPVGKNTDENKFTDIMEYQLKSVKKTQHFDNMMNQLHPESQEYNHLLKYYDSLLKQLRQKDLNESQENSTCSVVNMRRQHGSVGPADSGTNTRDNSESSGMDNFRYSRMRQLSLNDFEPLRYISKGGYGSVVQVRHQLINKPLAIKVMKKEDMIRKNSVNRIKLEAKIYKTLEQSNMNGKLKRVHVHFSDFVVRCYGSFKTQSHLFIVLDYCHAGDLGHMLEECGSLGEDWSCFLVAEIILGLSLLHACGIIYNDMKPENILLGNNGHIKFTDFGISKVGVAQQITSGGCPVCSGGSGTTLTANSQTIQPMVKCPSTKTIIPSSLNVAKLTQSLSQNANINSISEGNATSFETNEGVFNQMNTELRQFQENIENNNMELHTCSVSTNNSSHNSHNHLTLATLKKTSSEQAPTIVGTPNYLAPELLNGHPSSPASDFWAVGVTLFELIYGYKPFEGSDLQDLFENIQKQEPEFPDDMGISDECVDFIKKLLDKNPTTRYQNYAQVRKHPFFAHTDWENIFRKKAYYIPPPQGEVEVDQTFIECKRNGVCWATAVASDNVAQVDTNPSSNIVRGNSLDDQFKDFSFVNQQLIVNERLQEKIDELNSNSSSTKSVEVE